MAEAIDSLAEIDEAIQHASKATHVDPRMRAAFIDGLLDARIKAARTEQQRRETRVLVPSEVRGQ